MLASPIGPLVCKQNKVPGEGRMPLHGRRYLYKGYGRFYGGYRGVGTSLLPQRFSDRNVLYI